MKAWLIATSKDMRELLEFQLTSQFEISIREFNTEEDAQASLEQAGADLALVITPYRGKKSEILRLIRRHKLNTHIIFYFDPAISAPKKEEIQELTPHSVVAVADLVKESIDKAREISVKVHGLVQDPSSYCPIRTKLLIKVSPLKGDIYIKLSKEKYLKLFQTGDEFTSDDLDKYAKQKNIEFMHLKRSETAEFVNKLREELDRLLVSKDLTTEGAMTASEMSQEAVHSLVNYVGFTEEVQEIVKKNAQLTLKAIGQNPRLSDLLKHVMYEKSYLSNHSTLLAHVACCVAKESELANEAAFAKLTMAAFMHDVTVIDPELAKVRSLTELARGNHNFDEKEVKNYHLHPANAADLVRRFTEIPSDVDQIVQQHHERPDGSGFPRGLSPNYISPLSSAFIIAHDITQELLERGKNFSLPFFVSDKKPYYSKGHFKKIMASLEKLGNL